MAPDLTILQSERDNGYIMKSKFTDIRVRNATIRMDMVGHTAIGMIYKITKITLLYKITPRNADGISTLIKFDLLSLFSTFNKHALLLRMVINHSNWLILVVSIIDRTSNDFHFQRRFFSRGRGNALGNSAKHMRN